MAVIPTARLMTAEEFMKADLGDGRFELVRGEAVEVSPPYFEHAYVCTALGTVLFVYGRDSGNGYSVSEYSLQTRRDPDTVRGPDVSFYSDARLPRSKPGSRLVTVAPDVAIEVASPSNSKAELLEKVAEYLAAGSLAAWLVYPKTRSVAIFRDSQTPPEVFKGGDAIENQPELPGFHCLVSEIFP